MIDFGIEEEFFLIDRRSRLPSVSGAERDRVVDSIRAVRPNNTGEGSVVSEWLTCQVESVSPVLTDTGTAMESLLGFRRALATAVDAAGIDAVAMGVAPTIPWEAAKISPGERYREFADLAPGIAADQYLNGMHVHLSVPDKETGVRMLNGLRIWLPLLTALGANSPLWRGTDSGFDSWRTIHYRRWMTHGPPPFFHDSSDYDKCLAGLLATDVIPGQGSLGWNARLSAQHPTVEIRACDVQLVAEDAVVLALLMRAMGVAAQAISSHPAIDTELLRAAEWQAARFGLSHRLVDPAQGISKPAGEYVHDVLDQLQPFFGDTEEQKFVQTGLERLLLHGTGARRQRAAFLNGDVGTLLRYAAALLPVAGEHALTTSGN